MSRFIESICVEDSELKNLSFHQERLNRTFEQFYPNQVPYDLSNLNQEWPKEMHKLRVVYDHRKIECSMSPYQLPKIKTLKIIDANEIDYQYKSIERSKLDKLFEQRDGADDIAIIKNGFLTDSWFANFALFKDGLWFTPEKPLLKGTKREMLIRSGKIIPENIKKTDLRQYSKACLINAMIDLDQIVISFV